MCDIIISHHYFCQTKVRQLQCILGIHVQYNVASEKQIAYDTYLITVV